ncbi:MAG TPA: flagellar basal body-associated FliL family protein [Gemmatimonadaceae bacterium]|nr:flagellar basal body-associated FliL family protein [Gemmatimonadaceae bacterium]
MPDTPTPAPEGAEPKPKPKRLLLIVLAVIGLAVGGAGGAMVAPRFAPKTGAATSGASTAAKAKDGAHGDSTKGEAAEAAMHTVDNLVMNPAGTGGTRFIMVTVALQLAEAEQVEALKQRDAELRDLIVSLFSRKTVDELSDAARRDALRGEVAAAVAPLVPKSAVRRVFFPQFVIQ